MLSTTWPHQSMFDPYSHFSPGSKQQRRHDRCPGRGDDAGLAMFSRQAVVVLVEKIVAETGRVQHQHTRGDVALGRTQFRLAVAVEAFEHLEISDIGREIFRRHVEVELALLHALHHRRSGDRLGGRKDRHDAVRRHRMAGAQYTLAGGTFVDVCLSIRNHGDYAGYARRAADRPVEDLIACTFQGHGFLPSLNRDEKCRACFAAPPRIGLAMSRSGRNIELSGWNRIAAAVAGTTCSKSAPSISRDVRVSYCRARKASVHQYLRPEGVGASRRCQRRGASLTDSR